MFSILEAIDQTKSSSKSSSGGDILRDIKDKIRVANTLTLEAYSCCPYITLDMPFEDIENINVQPYFIGLLRDDFIYFSKIEDLFRKKISKDDPT